jgi:hypothetical protein
MLRMMPSILDRSIVIYPEITTGNPLRARHVVRYLLNRPGFFNGRGMESYGASEYFIHFAEEFRLEGLKSRPVRLPLVDKRVFAPPTPGGAREGFLVYCDRYCPDIGSFPDWVGNPSVISREAPLDPTALAGLYRRSRALIVGERTAAITEALHCQCPVILLTHPGFDHQPVAEAYGGCGLLRGFNRNELAQATAAATMFPAIYAARFEDVDQSILAFVADVEGYFGLRGDQEGPRHAKL